MIETKLQIWKTNFENTVIDLKNGHFKIYLGADT